MASFPAPVSTVQARAPSGSSAQDPCYFRKVLGHHPTGVVMVSTTDGGTPAGMLVSSFSAVSLKPPLVSFLADCSSHTQACIQRAGRFCANVLAADQEALSRKLARHRARRFDDVEWTPSAAGNPIISGCIAWIDCSIVDVVRIGDHNLIVGDVHTLCVSSDKTPLLFFRGQYGDYSPIGIPPERPLGDL